MGRRCRGWLVFLALLLAGSKAAMGQAVLPPVAPIKENSGGKSGPAVALFNGKDLAGWTWHSNLASSKIGDVWTVKEGVLHCAAVRGNGTGYIATEKTYKDFVLTIEYRHVSSGNGGFFICMAAEDKVWPDSVQVQGNFGRVGDLLNQNSGMKKMMSNPARTKTVNRDVVVSRIAPEAGAAGQAEKPLGQWNTLVITMEGGKLSVTNNGLLLNTAAEITPDSGRIGIQAEGAEMEYRRIELVPIESLNH